MRYLILLLMIVSITGCGDAPEKSRITCNGKSFIGYDAIQGVDAPCTYWDDIKGLPNSTCERCSIDPIEGGSK